MNSEHVINKLFFFWGDGMAETRLPDTSLARAHTPTLDSLFENGETGFYQPVIKAGSTLPKTDIVIPYMVHIPPEAFAGRAALEFIDAGHTLPEGVWVGSFRVSRHESSSLDRFSEKAAAELHHDIKAVGTAEVMLCPYSSHKNMFAIIDKDRSRLVRDINAIERHLEKMGITLSQIEIQRFRTPESPFKDVLHFVGWSRGSLRGTFRLIASGVNDFTPQRYCFQEYQDNMRHLQKTNLKDIIDTHDILTFFIKESDSASHAGDQGLKVKAIETLDWVIGEVRPYMPPDAVVVVLADHPTDLNAPTAINAPTPYLMANAARAASTAPPHHFCEAAIASRSKDKTPLTMFELREKIYQIGSKGW